MKRGEITKIVRIGCGAGFWGDSSADVGTPIAS